MEKRDNWGRLLVRGFPRDGDKNSGPALVKDPDGTETVRASGRNPTPGEVRLVPYGAASSAGTPTNTEALSRWRERKLIDAIALSPNFATRVAQVLGGVDFESAQGKAIYQKMVDEAHEIAATDIAADRGTQAHRIAEIVDTPGALLTKEEMSWGVSLGLSETDQRAFATAWWRWTTALGLETLGIEVSVVNDDLHKAGTFDRLYRATKELRFNKIVIPAGTVLVGDLKTSGKIYYTNKQQVAVDYQAKHAAQVATYAGGTPYDATTRERSAWAEQPSLEYGVIMRGSLPEVIARGEERFSLWALDLAAGRKYVEASNALAEAEKEAQHGILGEVAPDQD